MDDTSPQPTQTLKQPENRPFCLSTPRQWLGPSQVYFVMLVRGIVYQIFPKISQYFYDILWDVGLPEDMVLCN